GGAMPKSKHQVPGRVRSAYAFIKAHRDQYSVQMMCRVIEVAVSGYYDWLKQPISNHDQEDARLLRLIARRSSRVMASTEPLACSPICVKQERPAASTEHEPQGQLLGQRRRRILLQQLEKGADQETDVQETESWPSPTLLNSSTASTIQRVATAISVA